jgi:hypothetical protein
MPDNPFLQWTLDAKRALQQSEQLSSHANILVRDSSDSLDRAESLVPKCAFLKEALKGQVGLLERVGGGCYVVEDHARREFEVSSFLVGLLTKGVHQGVGFFGYRVE